MSAAALPKRDVLVSIRPFYADKIVKGIKTVELRRRFTDDLGPGAFALIYSTSPVQAIIGSVSIKSIHHISVKEIWNKYSVAACVDKQDFDNYFSGLGKGYALVLGSVRRFRTAIKAAELSERFGFVPPQSFRYLAKEYYSLLPYGHVQAPH